MAKRKTPYDKVKKHLTLPRWLIDQVEQRRVASGSTFGSQVSVDLIDSENYTPPKPKAKPRRR